MSVSENVTKHVCAIDHFIGKYSFLLIKSNYQEGEFFDLRTYPSSAVDPETALRSVFTVCLLLFILASTAKVISEHHLKTADCLPWIEPGTLRLQANHEMHYAT